MFSRSNQFASPLEKALMAGRGIGENKTNLKGTQQPSEIFGDMKEQKRSSCTNSKSKNSVGSLLEKSEIEKNVSKYTNRDSKDMTVKKEDDDFWSYVANVVGQREKMNRKDKEGKTKKTTTNRESAEELRNKRNYSRKNKNNWGGMQIPFSWEYGTPQVAGGEAQAIEAEKIEKKEDTNNQIEESKVENEQEKEIQVEGNEDTSTEVLLAQPQQQTSPFYINTTAAAEEEKEIEKEKEHEAEIATEQEENKHENKQEEINKEAKEEEKENEVSEVVNPNPAGDERDEEINRIIIEEKRKYREKYSNYYSELSKNLRSEYSALVQAIKNLHNQKVQEIQKTKEERKELEMQRREMQNPRPCYHCQSNRFQHTSYRPGFPSRNYEGTTYNSTSYRPGPPYYKNMSWRREQHENPAFQANPRPLYRNIVWRRDQEEASAAPTAAAARAAAAPTAAAARAAAPTVKPPGYLGKKPFVSRYTQGADGFYYRTDKPLPPPRTVSAATLPSLSPELQQQLQQQQQQLEQQLKQQALQQKMKEECRRYHMMGLQERQQLLLQQQFLQTQSYSTSAAVGGKLRETPKVEWSRMLAEYEKRQAIIAQRIKDGTEAPAPPTRCDVAMAFFLANRKELHLV